MDNSKVRTLCLTFSHLLVNHTVAKHPTLNGLRDLRKVNVGTEGQLDNSKARILCLTFSYLHVNHTVAKHSTLNGLRTLEK